MCKEKVSSLPLYFSSVYPTEESTYSVGYTYPRHSLCLYKYIDLVLTKIGKYPNIFTSTCSCDYNYHGFSS